MAKKKKDEVVVEEKAPKSAIAQKKELTHPEGTMIMCDDGVERPVISRDSAIAQDLNRYFLGEVCKNGHMAERKVKGYVCTTCARNRMKARRKERLASDPEFKAKVAAKRQAKHKERYNTDPEYRQKVLDKAKARRVRRREEYLASPEGIKAEAEKQAKAEAKAAKLAAKEAAKQEKAA